jgi:hypothetical protein
MNEAEAQQVADDAKPMTGIWYHSTTDPRILGKVTAKTPTMVTVTFTGGGTDPCTYREFADSWEMD